MSQMMEPTSSNTPSYTRSRPSTFGRAARCSLFASLSLAVFVGACSSEPPRHALTPAPVAKASEPPVPRQTRLPDYIIGNVNFANTARNGTTIPLDPQGRLGMLMGGSRFVIDDGQARPIAQHTRESLSRVHRIPSWLGGGFLFQAGTSIFSADTFDGDIHPVITLPESISRISFGPKNLIVRGNDGGRWAIRFPFNASRQAPFALNSNGRVPLAPIGLADIAALADGRAFALTEGGGALASINRGDTWTDISNKIGGMAVNVDVVDANVFLSDSSGRTYKLEINGSLLELPRLPSSFPSPKQASDPRWHGATPPRELALTAGAMIDATTAVVAAAGDVATIDIRTGAIKSIVQGRLPMDLTCEVLRVPNDVLIVCGAMGAPSIVASGLLTKEGLHIERKFPSDRQFFADEEGTLVFGGPCTAESGLPGTFFSACSRDQSGQWTEHTNDRATALADADAKIKGVLTNIRWIPRRDKPPIVILVRTGITVVDPLSSEPITWQTESLGNEGTAVMAAVGSSRTPGAFRTGGPWIDRGWSVLPSGVIRGWIRPGRSIEVSPKGGFTFSPFRFENVAVSGALALATSKNRLWQTLDRGETWTEISTPPSAPWTLRGCSPVGCDLGAWQRIGWEASTPNPTEVSEVVESPPLASPARDLIPEISCVPIGQIREATLPPSIEPDRGIGATKIPFSTSLPNGQSFSYETTTYSRTMHNPPRSTRSTDETSPFLMIHNFAVTSAEIEGPAGTSTILVVLGPSSSLASFKQTFTFVSPFDPAGTIHSPTVSASVFATAARIAGTSLEEALTNASDREGFVPILPIEPGAPANLLFASQSVVGLISAGNVKCFGQRRQTGTPVSAIELPGGDIAVLVASMDNNRRVLRINAAGTSEWSGAPGVGSGDLQTANPDALAIGPDGSLAIIRTPSGDEPASANDPALLMPLVPGASSTASVPLSKITLLAPWSTLASAASTACLDQAYGYRAIVQTKAPWVRRRGAAHDSNLDSVVMLAQVRWSTERVCLEAIELPSGIVSMRDGSEMVTMTVARFAPQGGLPSKGNVVQAPSDTTSATAITKTQPNAGLLGITLGAELHQPLACSIAVP